MARDVLKIVSRLLSNYRPRGATFRTYYNVIIIKSLWCLSRFNFVLKEQFVDHGVRPVWIFCESSYAVTGCCSDGGKLWCL